MSMSRLPRTEKATQFIYNNFMYQSCPYFQRNVVNKDHDVLKSCKSGPRASHQHTPDPHNSRTPSTTTVGPLDEYLT